MEYSPVANNAQYCLSIRFFPDGFSLFVSGDDRKTVVSRFVSAQLSELSVEGILDLLSSQEEINLNFGTIRLIVESQNYTLVPAGVFRDGDESAFLHLLYPELPHNLRIAKNELFPWNAILVYAMPVNLHEALRTTLPELVVEHYLSAFMSDNVPLSSDTAFFAFLRGELVDLMVFDNGNPLLINNFQCKSVEDLLYYLLKIAGQYNIDTYRVPLKLYNAERVNGYQSVLEKYFSTCEIYNKE